MRSAALKGHIVISGNVGLVVSGVLVVPDAKNVYGGWTTAVAKDVVTQTSSLDNLTVATPLAFQIVAPGNKSLGAMIGDLINSITADKDLGAKAALTSSGHLIISSPSGSGLSISGTEAVFGDWTDVIEGPYSVDSSRWHSFNRWDHGHWYRQKLDVFSNSLRIYGSKKPLSFVAMHVKGSNGVWDQFEDFKVQYKVAVQTKTAVLGKVRIIREKSP